MKNQWWDIKIKNQKWLLDYQNSHLMVIATLKATKNTSSFLDKKIPTLRSVFNPHHNPSTF